MKFDYAYLCENLGHLSGLQVRVFKGKALLHSYVNQPFEPDPATPVLDRIWQSGHSVGYYDILSLVFVGAIKVPRDNITLVVGPTAHLHLNETQIAAFLRSLGEPDSQAGELVRYFRGTPSYPLENFLHILCFVHYALSGEKLTVRDLIGQETSYVYLNAPSPAPAPPAPDEAPVHNTLEMEKALYALITAGRPDELSALFEKPPTGRVGKIAHDELRQRKNTFVIAAALASRAAIAGGMQQEVSFSMSDLYIQKAELLSDHHQLTLLNMEMLLEYARQVERVNRHGSGSKLVAQVARYITGSIGRRLTTGDIAAHIKMNRTHLCERFKAETGITLCAFITEQKLLEAKRLLATSQHSILHISEVLGFSSQGYFQNVFKNRVGCTPKAYREGHLG